MPLNLLRSSPRTADGYDGRGIAIAMGILGRNKGLQPWRLVYHSTPQICSLLENASTWSPRPSKVLRSFYQQALDAQYHRLEECFVNAAVELALLAIDTPNQEMNRWLTYGLEQQSTDTAELVADAAFTADGDDGRTAALVAMYESSYVAMIVSLNAMEVESRWSQGQKLPDVVRPEVICAGLLMRARGMPQPGWWEAEAVREKRNHEVACLSHSVDWRTPTAQSLGLHFWPVGFDDTPSIWEGKTG